MRITILGAGVYGSALGHILEEKHEVVYYDITLKITLEEALKNAETILISVPSAALPSILPKLPKNVPLIVATKGILDFDIFKSFEDVMILSGPGFAADIERHHKTKLTATDQRIIDLFERDWLKFDFTEDKKGVLMCGSLKNIYAIYAGYKNYKAKTSSHEKFLKTAAEEMKAILLANDADPKTVDLECGKGDLRLTCNYPSRNYEFGQKIAIDPKYKPEKTVEGISALEGIRNGGMIIPKVAPILKELIKESEKWA